MHACMQVHIACIGINVCMSACMYVCMHVYIAWKKKNQMYEECEHIVITLNHIKTTIFMYNEWKYIFKNTNRNES